jgi:potassium/chloride transporter 9
LNSAVALILLFAIFVFIWLRHPATNWGDVSQALMYHQVRKYLLRLDETAEHAKFWRPSIVLFLDDMRTDMIDFCGTLKKGGLLVLGNVLVGELADLGEHSIRMRKSWLSFINVHKLKAFPQVTVAPSLRVGYQFLMQGSGLGGLRCNTIALPFYDARAAKRQPSLDGYSQVNITRSPSFYRDVGTELSAGAAPFKRERTQSEGLNDILEELSERRPATGRSSGKKAQRLAHVTGELPVADSGEYIGIIQDALTLEKNVLVCRNFYWTKQKDTKKFIDIWFEDDWEGSCSDSKALMLQLGTILTLKDNKKKERLRVMQVLKKTQHHADDILKKEALERQLADYRIRASVVQVYLRVESGVVSGTAEYENSLRKLISDNVSDTTVLFLQLPKLPKHIVKTAYTRDHSDKDAVLASDEYLKALCRMTEGIPVALVRAGEKADIISTSI